MLGFNSVSELPVSTLPSGTSSDVTVNITGFGLTVSKGSITIASDSTVAITGFGLTISKGSVLAAVDVSLTGQSIVVAKGSVLPATDVALIGQGVVISQGIITTGNDVTVAVTGFGLSVAQGLVVSVSVSETTAKVGGDDVPRIKWEKYKKKTRDDAGLEAFIRKTYKSLTGQEPPLEVLAVVVESAKESTQQTITTDWVTGQLDATKYWTLDDEEDDDEEAILFLLS